MKQRTIDLDVLIEHEEDEIFELKLKLYNAIKDKTDYSSEEENTVYMALKIDLKK